MSNACRHSVKVWGNPFGKSVPTQDEIYELRLWHCPDCGHWYSLLPQPTGNVFAQEKWIICPHCHRRFDANTY